MLQALRFLTVLQAGDGAAPGKSVIFFPLIGAALGWLGARALSLLSPWFGNALATLIVLTLWCAITGARHEIAFLRSLGHFGRVALALLIVMRWQAVLRLSPAPVPEFVSVLAMSRAAMVAIAYLSRPVGDGIHLGAHMTTPRAVISVALVLPLAIAAGTRALITVTLAGFLTSLLAKFLEERRGGVDTQSLFASGLFVETFGLVIISCRNCFW